MKKKIYIIGIIAILSGLYSFGQDPYYSQYFMSPMTVNPALIGKGVSDARILANQKSQWWGSTTASYRTSTISIEKTIAADKLDPNQLAVALMVMSDASNNNVLKNNYFTFGAAYNMLIANKSTLGVGLEATYANRILDPSAFQFQSQFGSMGFSRTMPANDPIQIANANYFDANAGVHYSYDDEKWGYSLGVAIFHAAKPKNGAYNNSLSAVDPRISSQFSIYKKLKAEDEIDLCGVLDAQGINHVFSLGAMYRFKIPGVHPIDKLNIGVWKRFGDAVYPYVGIEAKTWIAGFSYDFISSDIKTYYNSVQSLELSFGWHFLAKKSVKQTHVISMFCF